MWVSFSVLVGVITFAIGIKLLFFHDFLTGTKISLFLLPIKVGFDKRILGPKCSGLLGVLWVINSQVPQRSFWDWARKYGDIVKFQFFGTKISKGSC
jgi:hypothetical protein